MKLKYQKHFINAPSHIEREWKLCYNKLKLAMFTAETSPHGYCNSLLIQFGGDAWFYTSLSIRNVLISFSLVPYCA